MTCIPCPACPNTRAAGQYLCPTCWAALPRAPRRALMRRGPGALQRLRQLHDQIAAGVPLHRITIPPTEQTGSAPMTSLPSRFTGPYGTAALIPPAHLTDTPATLASWIVTAPCWHPLWSQYLLSVVTLAPMPEVPDATIYMPGATHELIVTVLDPDQGPHEAATATPGALGMLTPVNIAQQFTATDDHARQLAALCVRAVVDGVLCPETSDAPDRIRAVWAQSIAQTLDHDTDPHHGRAN